MPPIRPSKNWTPRRLAVFLYNAKVNGLRDAKGRAIFTYHGSRTGTNEKFNFSPEVLGRGAGGNDWDKGFYSVSHPVGASGYAAPNVHNLSEKIVSNDRLEQLKREVQNKKTRLERIEAHNKDPKNRIVIDNRKYLEDYNDAAHRLYVATTNRNPSSAYGSPISDILGKDGKYLPLQPQVAKLWPIIKRPLVLYPGFQHPNKIKTLKTMEELMSKSSSALADPRMGFIFSDKEIRNSSINPAFTLRKASEFLANLRRGIKDKDQDYTPQIMRILDGLVARYPKEDINSYRPNFGFSHTANIKDKALLTLADSKLDWSGFILNNGIYRAMKALNLGEENKAFSERRDPDPPFKNLVPKKNATLEDLTDIENSAYGQMKKFSNWHEMRKLMSHLGMDPTKAMDSTIYPMAHALKHVLKSFEAGRNTRGLNIVVSKRSRAHPMAFGANEENIDNMARNYGLDPNNLSDLKRIARGNMTKAEKEKFAQLFNRPI